ncbi:phage antirepressor [Mycobacteroides salmoniphilum]|uniref:phage antirepressor n=1 Tax=Mycobacteroides salmoniphilum TaxID=404941 RepID=UPI001066F778|nr:phage antirepressor KilAC domain-containing protein [Mycobacteroides salmoniphilum]TDZ91134.1 Phage antirepressor protein KilAC domain protein [Mycobacteroides salmoniphilum]
MSDVQAFRFDDTTTLTIRPDEVDGFHVPAPQIARALGFRDAFRLSESIPEGEKGYTTACTPGGEQLVGYLTEAGFYRALGQRQAARIADPDIRDRVERFQTWVFGTVLPAIRQTGTYSHFPAHPRELPSKKELAQWVVEAEERADAEAQARLEAESRAKELAIPASAWSHMADSAGDYAVDDAAKVLSRDPAINLGRGRLFSFMAAEGWIFRDKGTSRWKAYQTQVDTGRLVEKLGSPYLHEPTGEMKLPAPTIRITAKGLAELHNRLGGSAQMPMLA